MSVGLLWTTTALNRVTLDRSFADNPYDTLDVSLRIEANETPSCLFATFDLSFTVFPFRQNPRLGFGIQASMEATKNNTITHKGRLDNTTTGISYPYQITSTSQFRTVGVTAQYYLRPFNRAKRHALQSRGTGR
jgi:hypothetical protein